MRLIFLTALTMIAFAANSVLNRMALADGVGDAVAFAAVRALAGAAMLAVLVLARRRKLPRPDPWQALWLMIYLYGFSMAYLAIGSGVGALILFGTVQITMFAGAALAREPLPPTRLFGAGLACAGLIWLLWPGAGAAPPLTAALFMLAAGVGWGLYSLAGRGARDPLGQTALNFGLGVPFAAGLLLMRGLGLDLHDIGLAVLSGAVTSGLGYALWYLVVPGLGPSRAAVAQLTVPVLAMAGGMALLAEPLSGRFILSSVLVLGGVALAVLPRRA